MFAIGLLFLWKENVIWIFSMGKVLSQTWYQSHLESNIHSLKSIVYKNLRKVRHR